MRCVLLVFWKKLKTPKKTFRNYLTFIPDPELSIVEPYMLSYFMMTTMLDTVFVITVTVLTNSDKGKTIQKDMIMKDLSAIQQKVKSCYDQTGVSKFSTFLQACIFVLFKGLYLIRYVHR